MHINNVDTLPIILHVAAILVPFSTLMSNSLNSFVRSLRFWKLDHLCSFSMHISEMDNIPSILQCDHHVAFAFVTLMWLSELPQSHPGWRVFSKTGDLQRTRGILRDWGHSFLNAPSHIPDWAIHTHTCPKP